MLKKASHVPATLAAGERPVLLVVVDTEEEFAWDRPFDRASTGTTSIAGQPLMHERVFDKFGIVPTYVCDYPVVTTPASVAVLRRLMEEGRCEIGTHLHPWVSPPHQEQVTTFNSYAGNLPRELEYEKLRVLTAAIADNVGRAPVTFKAGRYGLGPHTAESIASLGYEIDASVVPYTAFTDDGGPDFRAYREHPYWFQAGGRELLELPATTGYAGWLRTLGPQLREMAQRPLGRNLRMGGILARSRAVERIRLTPEGASCDDMTPDRRVARRRLPGVFADLPQPVDGGRPHALRARRGGAGALHRHRARLLRLVPRRDWRPVHGPVAIEIGARCAALSRSPDHHHLLRPAPPQRRCSCAVSLLDPVQADSNFLPDLFICPSPGGLAHMRGLRSFN